MTVDNSGNFNDVIGSAIERFHRTGQECFLQLCIDGEPEPPMPVSSFFRNRQAMNALEDKALEMTHGKVLDVGAGAGSHALELQQSGYDVTAVEISPSAAAVIRERGVKNVVCAAIADVHEGRFDTIVLLMNGFGIAGNEVGLEALLKHLKTLLAPSGSILADSTNLREWEERAILNLSDGYHGEVMFRVADGELSDEFGWIYPDEFLLEALCDELGLSFEVVQYGERGSFLCRISHER